jgi:DNA invertase Pin-like site-specific DNA recombinase
MPCVGYVRVSTDRQAGERQTSLADQQKAIEGLAAKLGQAVESWYRDEGASGATVEKRPALRALLSDCLAAPRPRSRPGYVLVLNDSRWGRFPNPDQAAALRFQLDQAGWLVRFVEGDESDDPTMRHVMRAIGGAQASEYRRNVQRNARRGSRGTAAQGFWATRAPYGYRRVVVFPAGAHRVLDAHQRKAPNEKVALEPHAAEAAIVRELFLRYATGTESLASLAEWARAVDPSRRWSARSIMLKLSNPAYVGDVISGRVSRGADGKIAAVHAESDWVMKKDAHPPIIDRDTFARCQEVLARNAKWTKRVRSDWVVSGLVRCRCGKAYVAGGGNSNRARGRADTLIYRCVTKAGLKADRCQYVGAVKKEWLEAAVVDTLAAVIGSPKVQRETIAALDAALDADPPCAGRDRRRARQAEIVVDSLRRRRRRLEGHRDSRSAAGPTSRSITTPKRSRSTPRTIPTREHYARTSGTSTRSRRAAVARSGSCGSPRLQALLEGEGREAGQSAKVRGLAWVAVRWAKAVRRGSSSSRTSRSSRRGARSIARRHAGSVAIGAHVPRFVGGSRLGYVVEWRELRACDFGAPTIRKRSSSSRAATASRSCGRRRRTGRGARSRGAPRRSASTSRSPARRSSRARSRSPRTRCGASARASRFVFETRPQPFIVGVGGRQGQSPERPLTQPYQTITSKNDSAIVAPFSCRATASGKGRSRAPSHASAAADDRADAERRVARRRFLAKHYGGHETPGTPLDPRSRP